MLHSLSAISLNQNPQIHHLLRWSPFTECNLLEEMDVSDNTNFVFADEVLLDKVIAQVIHCRHDK